MCTVTMNVPGSESPKTKPDKATMTSLKKTQLLMRAIQLNYQQHWLVPLSSSYLLIVSFNAVQFG